MTQPTGEHASGVKLASAYVEVGARTRDGMKSVHDELTGIEEHGKQVGENVGQNIVSAVSAAGAPAAQGFTDKLRAFAQGPTKQAASDVANSFGDTFKVAMRNTRVVDDADWLFNGFKEKSELYGAQAASSFHGRFMQLFAANRIDAQREAEATGATMAQGLKRGAESVGEGFGLGEAFKRASEGVGQLGGKFGEAGEEASGLGEKLGGLAAPLAMLASPEVIGVGAILATVGALGEVVSKVNELGEQWEELGHRIEIQTGATGERLEGLKDQVKDVYGQVTNSMGDVENVVSVVNTAFRDSGQGAAEVATQVSHLQSMIGAIDTTSLGTAFKGFNIGGDAAQQQSVIDQLLKTSHDTQVPVNTLIASMQRFAPIADQFHLSMRDSLGMMDEFAQAGIKPQNTLFALSHAAQEAAKSGKDFHTALQDDINAIKNAPNEQAAAEAAKTVFGPTSGRGGAALAVQAIRSGQLDLDPAVLAKLEQADGLVNKTWHDTLTWKDTWKLFGHETQVALAPVSEELHGKVQNAMEGIVSFLATHQGEIVNFATGVVNAFEKGATGIGNLVKEALPGIRGAIDYMRPAFLEMLPHARALAESFGPFAAALGRDVVPIVKALGEALIWALTEGMKYAPPVLDFLTQVVNDGTKAADWLHHAFGPGLHDDLHNANDDFKTIKQYVEDVVTAIKKIEPEIKTWSTEGKSDYEAIKNDVKEVVKVFDEVYNKVKDIVETINKIHMPHLDMPNLNPFTPPNPAHGQTGLALGGYGGGDIVPAMLEPGEHVFTKEEVSAAGGHENIYLLRHLISSGLIGDILGFQTGGAIPTADVIGSGGGEQGPGNANKLAPSTPGDWGPGVHWGPWGVPGEDPTWLTPYPWAGWPNQPFHPLDPWEQHRKHLRRYQTGGGVPEFGPGWDPDTQINYHGMIVNKPQSQEDWLYLAKYYDEVRRFKYANTKDDPSLPDDPTVGGMSGTIGIGDDPTIPGLRQALHGIGRESWPGFQTGGAIPSADVIGSGIDNPSPPSTSDTAVPPGAGQGPSSDWIPGYVAPGVGPGPGPGPALRGGDSTLPKWWTDIIEHGGAGGGHLKAPWWWIESHWGSLPFDPAHPPEGALGRYRRYQGGGEIAPWDQPDDNDLRMLLAPRPDELQPPAGQVPGLPPTGPQLSSAVRPAGPPLNLDPTAQLLLSNASNIERGTNVLEALAPAEGVLGRAAGFTGKVLKDAVGAPVNSVLMGNWIANQIQGTKHEPTWALKQGLWWGPQNIFHSIFGGAQHHSGPGTTDQSFGKPRREIGDLFSWFFGTGKNAPNNLPQPHDKIPSRASLTGYAKGGAVHPASGGGREKGWVIDRYNMAKPKPMRFQDGGEVAPYGGLTDVEALLSAESGRTPYSFGGYSPRGIDCSGLVAQAVETYLGLPTSGGHPMATGNEGGWLAAHGFRPGYGPEGSFRVGFYNGGPGGGHTALTLPDGTNAEAGGSGGGVRLGGGAAGANASEFSDHWYLPPREVVSPGGFGGSSGRRSAGGGGSAGGGTSGGVFGASWGGAGGGGGGGGSAASAEDLVKSQDRVTEATRRLNEAQAKLDADQANPKKKPEQIQKDKDAIATAQEKLAEATQHLQDVQDAPAKGGRGARGEGGGMAKSPEDAMKGLFDIGYKGIQEQLPQGFSNPLEWGGVKSASALFKFFGALLGGSGGDAAGALIDGGGMGGMGGYTAGGGQVSPYVQNMIAQVPGYQPSGNNNGGGDTHITHNANYYGNITDMSTHQQAKMASDKRIINQTLQTQRLTYT